MNNLGLIGQTCAWPCGPSSHLPTLRISAT